MVLSARFFAGSVAWSILRLRFFESTLEGNSLVVRLHRNVSVTRKLDNSDPSILYRYIQRLRVTLWSEGGIVFPLVVVSLVTFISLLPGGFALYGRIRQDQGEITRFT